MNRHSFASLLLASFIAMIASGCACPPICIGPDKEVGKCPELGKKHAKVSMLSYGEQKLRSCDQNDISNNYFSIRKESTNIDIGENTLLKQFFQKYNSEILVYASITIQSNIPGRKSPPEFYYPIVVVKRDETNKTFTHNFTPGLILPNTVLNKNSSVLVNFRTLEGIKTNPGELQNLLSDAGDIVSIFSVEGGVVSDKIDSVSKKVQAIVNRNTDSKVDITNGIELMPNSMCNYSALFLVPDCKKDEIPVTIDSKFIVPSNIAYIKFNFDTSTSLFTEKPSSVTGSDVWKILDQEKSYIPTLRSQTVDAVSKLNYMTMTIIPFIDKFIGLTAEDRDTVILKMMVDVGLTRKDVINNLNLATWYDDSTTQTNALKHGVSWDDSIKKKALSFIQGWRTGVIDSSLVADGGNLQITASFFEGYDPVDSRSIYEKYNLQSKSVSNLTVKDLNIDNAGGVFFNGKVCYKNSPNTVCSSTSPGSFKDMKITLGYNSQNKFTCVNFEESN